MDREALKPIRDLLDWWRDELGPVKNRMLGVEPDPALRQMRQAVLKTCCDELEGALRKIEQPELKQPKWQFAPKLRVSLLEMLDAKERE